MSQERRVFLRYRREDLLAYLFSLVLVAIIAKSMDIHRWAEVAVGSALAYMAITFTMKRGGVRLNALESVRNISLGILKYPREFGESWWRWRRVLAPPLFAFVFVVLIETQLREHLHGTIWVRRFPWEIAVGIGVVIPMIFRTIMLGAHLFRRARVREILASSTWKPFLDGMSISNHLIHAYLTGAITQVCAVAPSVIFYRLTCPTLLRETLLILAFGIYSYRYRPPAKLFPIFEEWHERHHKSWFYFSVFHGHHHDAVPCGLIAVNEAGFLESFDRSLLYGVFFDSIVLSQTAFCAINIRGMLSHQYIPGVFPYSRFVVQNALHHVVHHFGSLLPIGFAKPRSERDRDYSYDNARVRWFLATVERYEGLAAEEKRRYLDPESCEARPIGTLREIMRK
jgi:hypothetical protein